MLGHMLSAELVQCDWTRCLSLSLLQFAAITYNNDEDNIDESFLGVTFAFF